MLNFLSMLKGAQGAAGATGAAKGGSSFAQGLGGMMAQRGGPAGKIGLNYVNAGLNAPHIPNIQAMLQGLPQGQQQQHMLPTNGTNPFLAMLMRGGM